jgi:glycosyltransferase involved in cell wall biosynthesis
VKNEIIVILDGFKEESEHIVKKYSDNISFLPLEQNQGMQTALNLGVYNANNGTIVIINDDNVLCKDWDKTIEEELEYNHVLTINQIEPFKGIFGFPAKDFGTHPNKFDYEGFKEYEPTIRNDVETPDGGIFPFAMSKKDYMIVGGFDTLYKSPFICDWDFFLKLDLNGLKFSRTSKAHFYHFVSMATKKGKNKEEMSASENPAAQTFMYKWGMSPRLFENNSHSPKDGSIIKGVEYK